MAAMVQWAAVSDKISTKKRSTLFFFQEQDPHPIVANKKRGRSNSDVVISSLETTDPIPIQP